MTGQKPVLKAGSPESRKSGIHGNKEGEYRINGAGKKGEALRF